MRTNMMIDIRPSATSIDGYWDLQIDGSGWEAGLDEAQIQIAVSQHISSTLEQLTKALEETK
jgi:hypothetical protein